MEKPSPERTSRAGDILDVVGMSYRQINDWTQRGVIPDNRDSETGWRRFSAREVFMMKVCKEIRDRFGVPVEKLKYVSDFMLQSGADHFSTAVQIIAILGCAMWVITDFDSVFFMDSELDILDLAEHGYFGGDAKAGLVMVKVNPLVNEILAAQKAPVVLPLHGKGKSMIEKATKSLLDLSIEEQKVIALARSPEVKSIEVVLRGGKIQQIKETKDLDIANLFEVMSSDDFQTLQITLRDGNIVSAQREVSTKPSS
jgi:DNA-binding transcriptional MerR regulator